MGVIACVYQPFLIGVAEPLTVQLALCGVLFARSPGTALVRQAPAVPVGRHPLEDLDMIGITVVSPQVPLPSYGPQAESETCMMSR